MTETPQQRSQRMRRAALLRWSKATRAQAQEQARIANAGHLRRFYDETDPSLPDADRWAQAGRAFRAHMVDLALRSSKARAEKKRGAA